MDRCPDRIHPPPWPSAKLNLPGMREGPWNGSHRFEAMHEASLIKDVLDTSLLTMRRAGGSSIRVVKLRVGALAGVVPEALQFAFDSLKSGTAAEDSQLEIDWKPALLECPRCQQSVSTESYPDLCPSCGDVLSTLIQGTELDLVSVEVSRDG